MEPLSVVTAAQTSILSTGALLSLAPGKVVAVALALTQTFLMPEKKPLNGLVISIYLSGPMKFLLK